MHKYTWANILNEILYAVLLETGFRQKVVKFRTNENIETMDCYLDDGSIITLNFYYPEGSNLNEVATLMSEELSEKYISDYDHYDVITPIDFSNHKFRLKEFQFELPHMMISYILHSMVKNNNEEVYKKIKLHETMIFLEFQRIIIALFFDDKKYDDGVRIDLNDTYTFNDLYKIIYQELDKFFNQLEAVEELENIENTEEESTKNHGVISRFKTKIKEILCAM